MNTVQLSDVQLVNLSVLITLRDNVKRDPVGACCKFGLRAEHAAFLADLSVERIFALVANVGQECLFPPRDDLLALVSVPTPLAGPITSVRPARKHTASPSQREPAHAQRAYAR